jgi:hypothetical protein
VPETAPREPGTARSVLPDSVTRPVVGGGSRMPIGRYRARCKNVTHHGSPEPLPDDLLPPGSPAIASDAATPEEWPRRTISHCHWCGRRCPEFVRQEFLRRRLDRRGLVRHDRIGPDHGHAA